MSLFTSRIWIMVWVVLILLTGMWFRITAYGDLRLSVASMDTLSYMKSAEASILSREAFVGERLFTTNVVYNIAGAQHCEIQALSIPATGKESKRVLQNCFSSIVLAQVVLSLSGWGFLIWSVSSALRSGLSRVISSVLLTAFAFTPQIADWDSILSSESLTFSLFALSLGLIIQLSVNTLQAGTKPILSRSSISQGVLTLVVLAMWIFTRDSNVYLAFILCLIGLPAVLVRKPTRHVLISALIALLLISSIALRFSFESGRWKIPLANAFEEYILPYPARISILSRYGMPSPASLTYRSWFENRAPTAYLFFLGTHPGFIGTTLFGRLSALFAENNQPYFKTPDLVLRNSALPIGDLLHAKSSSIMIVGLMLTIVLTVVAIRSGNTSLRTLAIIIFWLMVSAFVTLILTFFADPIGVERHVLFSLFLFRLLTWLCLLITIDLVLISHIRTAPN